MRIEIILPKQLVNTKALEAAIDSALDKTAGEVLDDFHKTTATWHHQPAFKIDKGASERKIFTSDDIYFFVSGGTRVRRVIMTPGFSPKTRYRWIGSGAGAGGVMAGPSRRINRPGIKAREFEKAIAILYERFFPKYIQEAIDEAVK